MLQNIQGMQGQSMQPQRPQASIWSGRPEFTEQTPLFNQGQQGVQNQTLQQLLSMLQSGGQNRYEGFEPIEQQARTGFAQSTVPLLAERFAGLGSGAGLSSPSFASQLGQHGAGLEQGLAALKSQYGLHNEQLNQNKFGQLANIGFQPSFQNNHFARQPG